MDRPKPVQRGIGGAESWVFDALVVLAPGSLAVVQIWRSNGASAGLRLLVAISAISLCVVIARRWGRRAQIAVLLIATIASTAAIIALVA